MNFRFQIALACIAAALIASPAAAQNIQADDNSDFELKYQLRTDYPPGIKHVFAYTEICNARHDYADTSLKDYGYTRKVVYFITISSPSRRDDGFKSVSFNIDSCSYYFYDSLQPAITYRSQDGGTTVLENKDHLAATIPMNNMLELNFSPYGELAKIESEEVAWLIDYVRKGGRQALDSLSYDIWLDRLSDQNLAQLANLPRNLIPEGYVSPDSVWLRHAHFRADGIDFHDTLSIGVDSFTDDMYSISAKSTGLRAESEEVFMPGYPRKVLVTSARGESAVSLKMARYGNIHEVKGRVMAEVSADSRSKGAFTSHLDFRYEVKLLGRWEW